MIQSQESKQTIVVLLLKVPGKLLRRFSIEKLQGYLPS